MILLSFTTLANAQSTTPKLLLAFTSFREQPRHPEIYFYEHDGLSTGKITGKVTPGSKRSDHHPALGGGGRWCLFAAEIEGKISTIQWWDAKEQKLRDTSAINKSPNAQMAPAFAAGGKLLCFEAWNRPGGSGRWDLVMWDAEAGAEIELPDIGRSRQDHRKPALSGDGRLVAYTTNARLKSQLTDIEIYDRDAKTVLALEGLNSPATETEPALSADGRLVAFVSNRSGGAGGRDIYVYDLWSHRLLPLPGLNSPGHEQSPALSPDGRFVAFVSERLDAAGERDIFLYDRQTQELLPTPGLNSAADEYDPSLTFVDDVKDP